MKTVNFTILIHVLLFVVGCGLKVDPRCMSKEQAKALCIADGIKIRPNPNDLYSVETDCGDKYRLNQCYEKQKNYFPYDR